MFSLDWTWKRITQFYNSHFLNSTLNNWSQSTIKPQFSWIDHETMKLSLLSFLLVQNHFTSSYRINELLRNEDQLHDEEVNYLGKNIWNLFSLNRKFTRGSSWPKQQGYYLWCSKNQNLLMFIDSQIKYSPFWFYFRFKRSGTKTIKKWPTGSRFYIILSGS